MELSRISLLLHGGGYGIFNEFRRHKCRYCLLGADCQSQAQPPRNAQMAKIKGQWAACRCMMCQYPHIPSRKFSAVSRVQPWCGETWKTVLRLPGCLGPEASIALCPGRNFAGHTGAVSFSCFLTSKRWRRAYLHAERRVHQAKAPLNIL